MPPNDISEVLTVKDEKTTNGKDQDAQSKKYSRIYPETNEDDIVISGMSGRFPNARNIGEYEYNLYNKVDMVDDDERRWKHFSPELPHRNGKLYDIEKFDAAFFGVACKDAHSMDPQCRMLLESVYEAILDAGINPRSLRGTRTGVYIGSCITESEKTWFYEKHAIGSFGITGCSHFMLPNRVSYTLGVSGPSALVDTACSSSLYALDVAFTAFRNGEIDAAIIGGTNLCLHPYVTMQFARLGVLAPNGYCRPFDKDATGYTRAEAISALFLQRKRNAKRIYASIMYSKTNCDGYKAEGITYPAGLMQEKLLNEFYSSVDITPNDLGYLEAHSTGTIVGDPEECSAIDKVLSSKRDEPLLIGSVKSNIGHAEPASGICSLIKAIFAFETKKIPPNINFTEVRPTIPSLVEGRLKVVSEIEELKKPYIGVNSFGFGGANAHTLLRGCPKEKVNFGIPDDNLPRIIAWAGRTEESVKSIFEAIEKRPLDAEFLALLYNIKKQDIPGLLCRGYGLYSKGEGSKLAKPIAKEIQSDLPIQRPIVWIFNGLGPKWTNMGSTLMEIALFKESIERSHSILKKEGINLMDMLTSKNSIIFENVINLFVGTIAIQIAIVDVLRTIELEPNYMVGHSIGELTCAYADGALTSEQTLLAACSLAKTAMETSSIQGTMATVNLGFRKLMAILPSSIDIAFHNGSNSTTISGPQTDISMFLKKLNQQGIKTKEVFSSNIPFYSRYVTKSGSIINARLKEIISDAKKRSTKWLSTSIPKNKWDLKENQKCSAEYFTNNILNPVLFDETLSLLPHKSMVLEIGPHGTLHTILEKLMPHGVHVPLSSQHSNENNIESFLNGLGKIYLNGINLQFDCLYPKIEWPVSRGTPNIATLIKWDHSEDWFVSKYENIKEAERGERQVQINIQNDDDEYMSGHIIDGKILVPATGYLQYVWEALSIMNVGPVFMDMPVEFEDVRFIRATPLTKDNKVYLMIMIHRSTGHFEITEDGALIVTGTVRQISNKNSPTPPKLKESTSPMVYTKDFYKELKLRGYHYADEFKSVQEARCDGLYGKVKWNYNWVTFIDCMLQISLLGTDSRSLMIPTRIRKLRIFGKRHLKFLQNMPPEELVYEVFANKSLKKIVAGGIEIIGLHASQITRRKSPGIPVLEKYTFLPSFPSVKLSKADALRCCVQLALENHPTIKVKAVEVDCNESEFILPSLLDALDDLPLVTGDCTLLTSQKVEMKGVQIENEKLSSQTNCMFVISSHRLQREEFFEEAQKSLMIRGFLISRENPDLVLEEIPKPPGFNLIAAYSTEDEIILLLRSTKEGSINKPSIIQISENDLKFSWLAEVQNAMTKGPVLLVAQNDKANGILGLTNCLRKEPNGNQVSCIIINDMSAPKFDENLPFYKDQLNLGLPINIYKNGKWGTYRHLQLHQDVQITRRNDFVYGNMTQKGDLSSLGWFEGNSHVVDQPVKIIYSALNFRDVMLVSGRLSSDTLGDSRMDQDCIFGLEFCGIDKNGKNVIGMIKKGSIASYTNNSPKIIWELPEGWTFEEGASVPVVYITVYYAFFICVDIRKGKSILIHSGTGGVGLAAIRVALGYGLNVFVTVGTPEKRKFLLETFPQLRESQIGNSRDMSFEEMIMRETAGNGVDFVLNSLAEEKLHASVRCLGKQGHFLEIGKYDIANNNSIGLGNFMKDISFHAVFADNLLTAPPELLVDLKKLIYDDIKSGIVKPLPTTIFKANEIEKAFRYMSSGKHMGKVMLQIRDDPNSDYTIPLKVIPQIYFDQNLVYVIPGGLGGFGLELVDWMILRGARKLVLSSSRGITKQYQVYRISLWESYGAKISVNSSDITTLPGCKKLIEESLALGKIAGIFNLAVILKDAVFANQTTEKFQESFAPKAIATKYLDEITRKTCPDLDYFVVFSSVSCGRGNAGQTNYGMANSVMERIIEKRVEDGLPGKAIQWGAVGEVGLVADLAEDKIDMEIGGTLQQRISSCLEELDKLLKCPDAIVSSMVVAEKRARSGNENVIETVMNIMSIKDLKSVSMGVTLSELGMDSLMAVEIKQTLERNFELFLTPQDLRSLTFQKLLELSEPKDKESSVKAKLNDVNQTMGLNLLLRNLGDETYSGQTILPLITKTNSSERLSKTIIIPGLEGCAGRTFYKLGRNLESRAVVLQTYTTSNLTTFPEITNSVYKDVVQNLTKGEPFYLIGYSYGSLIALELASALENEGYQGKVVLIDGSPTFLKRLCTGHFGDVAADDDIWNAIFTSCVINSLPNESAEEIISTFINLNNYKDKLSKFLEYAEKQKTYSKEFATKAVIGLFNRIRMTHQLHTDEPNKIESPITLVRPTEASLLHIAEDYELSKWTKNKVTIKFVDGNHATMIEDPKLVEIINENDPFFERTPKLNGQ